MIRAIHIGLLLVAGTAGAAPASSGRVTATSSRWSGDVIVTEATIVQPDGSSVTVTQLGGSVGGIGMWFSHAPSLLAVGDTLTLDATGTVHRDAPLDAGTATYGLQRTLGGHALHPGDRALSFVYDAAGTAHVPGSLELAVLDEAFAAWRLPADACGGFSVERTIAPALAAPDGISTVSFHDERWCRPATGTQPELCLPHDAAAVTRVLFIDDPTDPNDGTITEADIEINMVDFAPQVDGVATTGSGTPIDLLSVVTHEVGHSLGVAHDCALDESTWPTDSDGRRVPHCSDVDAVHSAATMFVRIESGDTSKRTLERNDVRAVCSVLRDLPSVTGGCSTTTPAAPLPIAIALLVIVLRRRR